MRPFTLLTAGFFGWQAACAATLDGDAVRMCDRLLQVTPELQPSALMEASAADLDARRFAAVYSRFADRFEATLDDATKAEPAVARFLANVRAARLEPAAFDAAPSDDRTRETLFENTDQPIALACDALPRHAPDMVAVSLMTGWVRGQERLPELERRARRVVEQYRDHEALLRNGLPMWPWELWLNGKRLGRSDWEPLFRTQWVVLRPTAGVEIDARSRAEGDLEASIGIEPLGFVRYRTEDYASWWGASLLVTASTREGIGLGGLLRWNDYVLGVTHHESDSPAKSDGVFIFLGVDLYDLVNRKREDFAKWKDLQRQRVGKLLKGEEFR